MCTSQNIRQPSGKSLFIIPGPRYCATARLRGINLSKDLSSPLRSFTETYTNSIQHDKISAPTPTAHLFLNRYKFSSPLFFSLFPAAILDCLAHRIAHATYGNINLTVVGIYEQKWSHLHARKAKFMRGTGI